jgi:putative DNA primase/helicase
MKAQHSFDAPCLGPALEYAARGWHVFPAPLGEKKSHVAGRFGNGHRWGATTEPDLIRQYWRKYPDANVGIACGRASGLLVIECDTPEGHDVDGIAQMRDLIARHGPLPDTIEALSPSGSWHLYFNYLAHTDVPNSSAVVAPGIDVRGEGGIVIGVPSIRPGKSDPYHWKNPPGLFELADCPDWLLQLCLKKQTESSSASAKFKIDTGCSSFNTGTSEVEEILSWIDPDSGGYYAWLDVLMGLHNHFQGSNEGLQLADLWSSQGAKYKVGEVADKWMGFSPDGDTTFATVAELARRNGADLSDIARRHKRGAAKERAAEGKPNGAEDAGARTGAETTGFDLSHDALTRELGRRGWDQNAKYVAMQGRWYFWDATVWAIDERLAHMTLARDFLQDRAREVAEWADAKAETLPEKKADDIRAWAKREGRGLRSANTVAAVASLARSNQASVTQANAFDADLLLLGTPGGTVDLRTGELRPARREDMISKMTAVTPSPAGTAAFTWLKFLNDIFEGDAEMISFLQRAAGYALTGLTSEHKLLFLHGTGRNGKSTFLETLQWIWGNYARRAAVTTFLTSVGERHPTDIAGLSGARLVVGSELPKGKSWDEAVLKDLTGGDTMTARFMRGDFFDFVPQMTLMIAGNNMPSLRGVDEALRARMVLVPFAVTIPPEKRDTALGEKLRREGPAILRWAIEGALAWRQCGLDVPPRVSAASTEYLDGEDLLGQFLADETVESPGEFTFTSALHVRFRLWIELQGLGSWSSHTFTKELKSRGFQECRRSTGRGFIGLRLIRP